MVGLGQEEGSWHPYCTSCCTALAQQTGVGLGALGPGLALFPEVPQPHPDEEG